MTPWKPEHELGTRSPCFFGLRVKPITLGHLRLLHELGIEIGGNDSGDAILTAFVLTQHHERSRRDVLKWWVRPLLRFIGYRYGRRIGTATDAQEFNEWLGFQLSGPSAKVRVESGKAKPRGRLSAPLHFNLIAGCLGYLGMNQQEAESTPVRYARQLLSAFHESGGNVELWTDEEYAFEAACKRMDEQRRKQREMATRN